MSTLDTKQFRTAAESDARIAELERRLAAAHGREEGRNIIIRQLEADRDNLRRRLGES